MTQMLKDIITAVFVGAAILIVLGVIVSMGIGIAVVASWLW
jgi:hypothetical protein